MTVIRGCAKTQVLHDYVAAGTADAGTKHVRHPDGVCIGQGMETLGLCFKHAQPVGLVGFDKPAGFAVGQAYRLVDAATAECL